MVDYRPRETLLIDHTRGVKYVGDGQYELTITTKNGPIFQVFKAKNWVDADKQAPGRCRKILRQLAGAVT